MTDSQTYSDVHIKDNLGLNFKDQQQVFAVAKEGWKNLLENIPRKEQAHFERTLMQLKSKVS
jgi:hypothetical protein